MRKIYALLITLLWTAPFAGAGVSTTLSDLRVQHSVEPLTVEEAHPLFSWKMVSPQPGQRQVSYRITVARECDGRLVWDSGEVRDSLSTGIPYQGVALQPNFSYGWNLTVTDGARDLIIAEGSDPLFGARPLKRYIQSKVESLLARHIIAASPKEGSTLTVDVDEDGKLTVA